MRLSLIVKIGIGFFIIFLTLTGIYIILTYIQLIYSDFEDDYYTFQTFYSHFNQLFYLQSLFFINFETNEHEKLKEFIGDIEGDFKDLLETDSYKNDKEIKLFTSLIKENIDVFVIRFAAILDRIETFGLENMKYYALTLTENEQQVKSVIFGEISLWINKAESVKKDLESIFRVLDREKAKLNEIKLIYNNILLVAGVVVSFIVSLFILIRFRISLSHLKNSVTALADGEGDLRRKIEITSRDEMGMLAIDFNRFIEKIKSIVMKIKSTSDVNMNIKENLFKCATDVGEVLTGISGNSENINNVVKDLDSQISHSIDVISGITKNIEELDRQISLQMQSVSQSNESVASMEALITEVVTITQQEQSDMQRLVDVIRNGNERLQKTTAIIDDIAEQVDGLLGVINLINNIVDKTGLLSMNASIEAAHAGAAGKGFAVVAGQIRKLAESTGKNANVISSTLRSVVDSIKEASLVYRESSITFQEIRKGISGIEKAFGKVNTSAERLASGGNQIKQTMVTLNDISTIVREGSSGMKSGAEQITSVIDNISTMSQKMISMTGDINEALHTISTSMTSMTNLSTKLKDTVELLNNEIDQFKT
ncbi:MAG: methyl-accepting chemotaxis protein [Spirochaetales bacterium]|nr:methyl-accepting chemotaxis protein [Spirochaetales bacterium]